MSLKNMLTDHLSPTQMKKVKWFAMQIRYQKSRLQKKCGTRKENKTFVDDIKTYSIPGKHVFFGYYDLQQFDTAQKKLLAHVIDASKCDPAKDTAELCYIDDVTGEFIHISETKAWSWQQGARLRWHPVHTDNILFNNLLNDHYVTVEWSIVEGRAVKTYPVPFYDITPDGRYGLSLNFVRLQRLRPGYGYSNMEDSTKGIAAPEGEGIFRYNTENDKLDLLVSLKSLAEKVDAGEDVEHYINHISIAPSGKKFLFFHLWTSVKTAKWDMCMYIADIETGKCECIEKQHIISHYCWKDDRYIIATTAAMNGKTPQYIEYDISEKTASIKEGEWLSRDGHPSYIHSSNDYISDTYPVGCMQYVFKQHKTIGTELLHVYSDPRLFDDVRCDLHPRITPDNMYITVDTTYKNKVRQIVVMKMKDAAWENYNERFLIVGLGNRNNAIKEMFYEVSEGKIGNAEYMEPFVIRNTIIRSIHRLVYSRRYRKYFRWIPHEAWEKYHVLNHTKLDKGIKNYVILTYGTDIDRLHFSSLIKRLKTEMGDAVCFVLMLFDPLSSPLKEQGWDRIYEVMKEFDIVASFDEDDARKYGLVHFTDPYAKREIEVNEELRETDLFFVGADKGRGNFLRKIEERLGSAGVNSDIVVVGMDASLEFGGLQSQQKYMDYNETLQHVINSNCLLEVLCDGQNSSSLRYYEAVVYNKKLLSNNPNIVNLPYYNPKYMRYFNTVNDIDVDWVKERCAVDYKYNGEFSIGSFLDKIRGAKVSNGLNQ